MKDDQIVILGKNADAYANNQTSDSFYWKLIRDARFAQLVAAAERAAPQPQADAQDAQRYRWLVDYFVSDRDDLDDAIVAARTSEALSKVIDAAIAAAKEI